MASFGAADRKGRGMTDNELIALLDGQITDAVSYEGSELSQARIQAFQFVDGQIDIPNEEGKSSVVSHDLADTLNWIMPGLLRVFLASDNIAIYEPRKPSSVETAKQATDYVNYMVMAECDGYRVFHGAMYDGLLFGNGIIKHWWDDTPQYSVETFTGLSEAQFLALGSDDDVEEILEHSEYPDPSFTFASANPNPALLAAVGQPSPGMPPQNGMPGGAVPPMGAGAGAPGIVSGIPAGPLGPSGPSIPNAGGMAAGIGQAAGINGAGPVGGRPDDGAGQGAAGSPAGPLNPLAALAAQAGPSMPPMGPLGGLPMAPPPPPMLHDIKIKRVTSNGRLMIKVLPPEEFLIERNATQLDEDSVRFCGHRYLETRSNLIKSGFDKDMVRKLPVSNYLGQNQERLARENIILTQFNEVDESVEYVEVYECYTLADYDGDGVAEWRKVVIGGPGGNRSVLANDEWGEDLPFTDLVPEPVPHRWRGRSLYDETADIQRMKSVLMRQTLDNLYQTNNPMQVVPDGGVINLDALINRELGATIFVKPGTQITPLEVPFTAKESFGMLDYLDSVREQRTGVSRQTMALDMDALQNQTATAVNAAQAASFTKQETYARNMAEIGMKRIFSKVLKLIVKHQDRPRMIRLRGQFVEMDPRAWDADMDLSINTGLGAGSRDRDMQMLMGIKSTQEQILMKMGPINPLCDLTNYYNTLAKMVETAGMKNVDLFFKEVTPQAIQQLQQQMSNKPPDPKVQAAQMKSQMDGQRMQQQAQLEQQKLQMQAQHEAAKAQAEFAIRQKTAEFDQQMEQARANRDAQAQEANLAKQQQIEQMQAQADIAVKQKEAEMKLMMEREKMQHQMQLEQQKFEFEKQLKLMDHHLRAQRSAPPMVAPEGIVVSEGA
jgi:hypothetical protein